MMSGSLWLALLSAVWYGLTRASRRWPWLGVLLGALFAVTAFAAGSAVFHVPNTEGSPAGMILFVVAAFACATATGLAVWFLALGAQGVLSKSRRYVAPDEDLSAFAWLIYDISPMHLVVFLGLGTLAIVGSVWWVLRPAERPQPAPVAARQPPKRSQPAPVAVPVASSPTPVPAPRRVRYRFQDAAALARRATLDELRADLPATQWPEDMHRALLARCTADLKAGSDAGRLKRCADALLAAWDASDQADRTFAYLPGDGAFAATIGDLYAAYAEASGDHAGGLDGVRAVSERFAQRFVRNADTVGRLAEQETRLRGAATGAPATPAVAGGR